LRTPRLSATEDRMRPATRSARGPSGIGGSSSTRFVRRVPTAVGWSSYVNRAWNAPIDPSTSTVRSGMRRVSSSSSTAGRGRRRVSPWSPRGCATRPAHRHATPRSAPNGSSPAQRLARRYSSRSAAVELRSLRGGRSPLDRASNRQHPARSSSPSRRSAAPCDVRSSRTVGPFDRARTRDVADWSRSRTPRRAGGP